MAGGHGNPLHCFSVENPMDRKPGGLQSIGSQRVGHKRKQLSTHAGLNSLQGQVPTV